MAFRAAEMGFLCGGNGFRATELGFLHGEDDFRATDGWFLHGENYFRAAGMAFSTEETGFGGPKGAHGVEGAVLAGREVRALWGICERVAIGRIS